MPAQAWKWRVQLLHRRRPCRSVAAVILALVPFPAYLLPSFVRYNPPTVQTLSHGPPTCRLSVQLTAEYQAEIARLVAPDMEVYEHAVALFRKQVYRARKEGVGGGRGALALGSAAWGRAVVRLGAGLCVEARAGCALSSRCFRCALLLELRARACVSVSPRGARFCLISGGAPRQRFRR